MSAFHILTLALLLSLLNTPLTFSADPNSPSPAPELGADVPYPSPSVHSPPAPTPDLPPSSPPAPAPGPGTNSTSPHKTPTPAPAPGPDVASDISHEDASGEKDNGDGGMSGGQKAGIAIGVIAGVFIVGAGAVVFKKRQSNIQRSQFGYDARREIL